MNEMERPTDKQKRLIQDITDALGYKFYGKTKSDASDFISQHLPELKWLDMDINDAYSYSAATRYGGDTL